MQRITFTPLASATFAFSAISSLLSAATVWRRSLWPTRVQLIPKSTRDSEHSEGNPSAWERTIRP